MKKRLKSNLIIAGIILLILTFLFWPSKATVETDEELSKCIGEKATLYSQLGCSHCKTQDAILGENIEFIPKIDCYFEKEKCEDIRATPSWKIGNKIETGVKTLQELKELTNC